jgi:major vault protein
VKQENEEIITGDKPLDFIVLKPYTYCLVKEPVTKNKDGSIVYDEHKQAKIRFGEQEIRTYHDYTDPFPLYPGELLLKIDKLTAIPRDCALKVRANRDFKDAKFEGKERKAGDEWQIKGPFIYEPCIEEDKVQLQEPIIIEINKAIKLRAKFACVDSEKNPRQAGEQWLVRTPGQYMLGVNEVFEEKVNGIILTDRKAIHLTSIRTFKDAYGKERRAGEEWLVKKDIASVHICDVYEKLVKEVPITVLKAGEYCYLVNPVEGNINQMGKKVLITGPRAFFIQPGEELEGGIKNAYILADDEALLLSAQETISVVIGNEKAIKMAGERWMLKGPCSYVPPVEVIVVERRKAIPMDSVEGIYIRNIKTGSVRVQKGVTYLLQEDEELAPKILSDTAEELVFTQGGCKRTEKSKLVTFKVPFNTASQIYDYKSKQMRVCFGPDLAELGYDEEFTLTHLSGKTPKRPGVVKTLYVMLGPVFSTDMVEVETSDHARLEMKLAFYWRFIIDEKQKHLVFNVRDFIGDMCKAMGSRVRSMVAGLPFDTFHKNSADYVRKAIFGRREKKEEPKETKKEVKKAESPPGGDIQESEVLEEHPESPKDDDTNSTIFPANNLEVFAVDIQSIEPKDKKTKESLDKTVTQAIQITTMMQEQEARRAADKIELEEQGKLEKLNIENKIIVEKAKKEFLELKALSDAVKTKGKAIAESKAKSEAAQISAKAGVEEAKLRANAKKVKEIAQIDHSTLKNSTEFAHQQALSKLKVEKSKKLATIQSEKFKKIMTALGKETLVTIAMAGPEQQAEMLKSLGLKGYMLMGSDNPVNLFTAANSMIAMDGDKPKA